MAISPRRASLFGLGLLSVGALVGHAFAQNSAEPKPLPPTSVGCIDLERVFDKYEKAKFVREELKATYAAKQSKLQSIAAEGKAVMKEIEQFQQGSKDFKDREAKLTSLKAQLEAERELAQREFDSAQADAMATFYKEVQDMVKRVAYWKKITHVLKISNEPIPSGDPQAVMMSMSRSVVFSDETMDITDTVISNLNAEYFKKGGKPVAAKADNATQRTGNSSAAPARSNQDLNPPARGAANPAASKSAGAAGRPR